MLNLYTWIVTLSGSAFCAQYSVREADWNININKTASNVLDYYAEWPGHDYYPSPDNWRFPFYSFFLDRWADGEPGNNNANETYWEFDLRETQFRAGGDVQGVRQSLDYLESMGIKGLYIIGTPYLNLPWAADQYAARDFSLLDKHLGTLSEWRAMIDDIHSRGMYVMLDLTVGTLSDYLGYVSRTNSTKYTNTSTPLDVDGYRILYKDDLYHNQVYLDFSISNATIACAQPVFYNDTAQIDQTSQQITCFDDDFAHYGDMEAFGVHPNWQRQLTKFASVQDRLAVWRPSVAAKLNHYACLLIDALDVDGFRIDKATQMTAEFLGDWSQAVRACADKRGKHNFFIPGEITGGNHYASIYLGRGRTLDQFPDNVSLAMSNGDVGHYIRGAGKGALDSSAFHYSFYRFIQSFLGIEGRIGAAYDISFQDISAAINEVFRTNDLTNANTGKLDPRHMLGMSNHDVFRWPAIDDGIQRAHLGMAMMHLLFPGVPLTYYGEEQDMKTLDNTAANYIFGRQPMFSTLAWQLHGCYSLGSEQFTKNVTFGPSELNCNDNSTSLDHFNPAHPMRSVLKQLHYLRDNFSTLRDAFTVQVLGTYAQETVTFETKQTWDRALWSTMRRPDQVLQDFGQNNLTIWFLYSNKADKKTYNTWDCQALNVDYSPPYPNLLAPYDSTANPKIRNLLYPYEEYTLQASKVSYYNDGKAPYYGCLDSIDMDAYSMKVLVPSNHWIYPMPSVVSITPAHDQRILASSTAGESLGFNLQFSAPLDCITVQQQLSIKSWILSGSQASFGKLSCAEVQGAPEADPSWIAPRAMWQISGTIENVYDGIHWIILQGNYTSTDGKISSYPGSEKFMFRKGTPSNPMVFPATAAFSDSLLEEVKGNQITLRHAAAGATKYRYSTNFGSSWSQWIDINDQRSTVTLLDWTGTKKQRWAGLHVSVEYWSAGALSSHHSQIADTSGLARVWPHIYAQGTFNRNGYDGAYENEFSRLSQPGTGFRYGFDLLTEWPANISLNVWGMNPDGRPDSGYLYGDLDNDNVLDRVYPGLIQNANLLLLHESPPAPYLSWHIQVDDHHQRYRFVPVGRRWLQALIYLWLLVFPSCLGLLATFMYAGVFNKVIRNRFGAKGSRTKDWFKLSNIVNNEEYAQGASALTLAALADGKFRRKILIATLEYDIPDLRIKIRIGGLGVMSQLMGTNLKHQDLIWVVPMVGDVAYPMHSLKRGETFEVIISDSNFGVDCYYHVLENITYVLLSSPVFSKQTKADPYPPRMDDLESAVFYSAWNQCIAKACKRFPIDLYHINDYHGALAPVYLLPKVVPCALSLHNAEFQGLWPLRKPEEKKEVCGIFSITEELCQKYVQFGNTFNLLHAGVSFLRLHQQGFGAVGVSDKYGTRTLARYPIFWSIKKIGKLPNPDPSDTGDVARHDTSTRKGTEIDWEAESRRSDLKREAQEWAGLNVDPTANLLVFVGRWSVQKGIDLIADLAPTILDDFNAQLITVGPVVDLHGKFAAEKLAFLMQKYPGRLVSKPVFTACPPALFSGADFALIPSRDEPFGLVAVEFGRKGALGIGCKVGGLGTMPGWWYTMNSASASHLLSQFEAACRSALNSSEKTRALLRARAAKQRFPVAVWVKQLDALQSKCIRLSQKFNKRKTLVKPFMEPTMNEHEEVNLQPPVPLEPLSHEVFQRRPSVLHRNVIPWNSDASPQVPNQKLLDASGKPVESGLRRQMSLGSRLGPHRAQRNSRDYSLEELPEEDDEVRSIATDISFEYDNAEYIGAEYVRGTAPEEEDFEQYMANLGEAPNTKSRSSIAIGDVLQDEHYASRYQIYPTHDPSIGTSRFVESFQHERGLYGDEEFLSSPSHQYECEDDYDAAGVASCTGLQGQASTPGQLFAAHSYGRANTTADEDLFSTAPPSLYSIEQPKRPVSFTSVSESRHTARLSILSLNDLELEDKAQNSTIKKGERMFTDANGAATRAFVRELQKGFSSAASKRKLCIQTFLVNAEKEFFDSLKSEQVHGSSKNNRRRSVMLSADDFDPSDRLIGVQRVLAMRGLGWPLYTILLALGQIMAANTYQLTLLGGQHNTATQLYVINMIFIVMSVIWYYMYRRLPAIYVLSTPFLLYSVAFILIGLPHLSDFSGSKTSKAISDAASFLYAAGSASGSLFFALNFGSEGGVEIEGMVYRACIVQGLQQLWSAGLWYWGHGLETSSAEINKLYSINVPPPVAIIVWFIGCLLFVIFVALLMGLPKYYRQTPGVIPAFYRSLYRRKVIVWFLFSQVLSNFWLSLPYGASWSYLWTSVYLPEWFTGLMIIFFFVIVWVAMLVILRHFSRAHTWVPVIFALGTISPRYFAELWAVSTIGSFLPWATSNFGSAVLGRSLWLWLTVLDSCQGVGLGIMLLQTLIRDHVAFTLVCAQVIGAFTTIIAKAADVPFSAYLVSFAHWAPGDGAGPFALPAFWLCFASQAAIPIGFFLLFRKSQLAF